MDKVPTIILDEATRRPLVQWLVDVALYSFHQGVEAQEPAADMPVDSEAYCLAVELKKVNEDYRKAVLLADDRRSENIRLQVELDFAKRDCCKVAEKWFEDWFPFPQEEHIADLRARMGVGNG